jgi:hypothetical protein
MFPLFLLGLLADPSHTLMHPSQPENTNGDPLVLRSPAPVLSFRTGIASIVFRRTGGLAITSL